MSHKNFDGFSRDEINRIAKQNTHQKNAAPIKNGPRPTQKPTVKKLGENNKEPKKTNPNFTLISDVSDIGDVVEPSIYTSNSPVQQHAAAFKPLALMNLPEEESILILPKEKQPEKTDVATIRSTMDQQVNNQFKGISMKNFEQHRKMMQEQNRQKKEMLTKAIEQKTQKTAAECNKLQEIKMELDKLDTELSGDVAILRKQIDTASLHFANVEKNYNVIENLFLKAKLELHQAHEKKELLTEHLFTIINHNEERKAKKLSELMEKVGLSMNGDYDDTVSSTNSN